MVTYSVLYHVAIVQNKLLLLFFTINYFDEIMASHAIVPVHLMISKSISHASRLFQAHAQVRSTTCTNLSDDLVSLRNQVTPYELSGYQLYCFNILWNHCGCLGNIKNILFYKSTLQNTNFGFVRLISRNYRQSHPPATPSTNAPFTSPRAQARKHLEIQFRLYN